MTDLAVASGVRRHQVYMWEAGVFAPSPTSLRLLSTALDADPLSFLVDVDPAAPSVYALRVRAGLDRSILAELVGISRPTVYRLERGHPVRLDQAKLARLAAAVGVGVCEASAAIARTRERGNPVGPV
ncbi:MAG: transcriptional regulator [Sporichthyaceae bacterium]|nr:transcriptional regulator [Sporichthyaceae bacterium]